MRGKIDFKAVAAGALSQADTLVPDWLPNGVRDGHEWRVGNIKGDKGRSLAVNLSSGVWKDFSSGEGGADLISLYAAIFTNNDQLAAARELGERLSIMPAPSQAPSKPAKPKWAPILPVPDDAPEAPKAHTVRGPYEARWAYHDSAGKLLGYVYRFRASDGGKEVIPCVWARNDKTGETQWRWMQFPEPRPLYGLDRFQGRDYVLVVEGEKCVDAGYEAMGQWYDLASWPGGGKAVAKADWSALAGRKVIIWPDADAQRDKDGVMLPEHPVAAANGQPARQGQPGIKAAEDVAAKLLQLGCQVRVVAIPPPGELPDGWDVADALQEGKTGPELKQWILGRLRESIHAKGSAPAQAAKGSSPPRPAGAGSYWKSQLLKKPRGGYEDCKENVALALEHHPLLQGMVGYNEFSNRIEKLKAAPWSDALGEWSEEDDLELSMWLASQANVLFRSTSTIAEGVRLVASRNKHHPVREWLESLEWDGQDRLSTWLHELLGADDSPYTTLVGTLWMRQAVNRILNPGCKGDYVLILEGTQGLMKSSALRTLGGAWFSDAPLDLNSKDAFMSISGTWIYEIAELDAFNRSEATRIKAFLTQSQDRYRPPYGSRMVTQLRQTVFAATTNNYEYHKDPTGNRRFWSVLARKVYLDDIKAVREQLFAQAVHEVKAGLPAYPTREQETLYIAPQQQMREIFDPWHEVIAQWLDEPENQLAEKFTSAQILVGAIKMDIHKIDGQRSATTRIGSIMMRLGWRKAREASGLRLYYYARPKPQKPAVGASNDSGQEPDDLPI